MNLKATRVSFGSRLDQLLLLQTAPALPLLRGWNGPDTNQTLAVKQLLRWLAFWSAQAAARRPCVAAGSLPPSSSLACHHNGLVSTRVSCADEPPMEPKPSPEVEMALASAHSAALQPPCASILRRTASPLCCCANRAVPTPPRSMCITASPPATAASPGSRGQAEGAAASLRPELHHLRHAGRVSAHLRLQLVTGDLPTDVLRQQLSLSSPHGFSSSDLSAASSPQQPAPSC